MLSLRLRAVSTALAAVVGILLTANSAAAQSQAPAGGAPALGYDKRLVIPPCGNDSLLRWHSSTGWTCDNGTIPSIRSDFKARVKAITDAVAALPIPECPSCDVGATGGHTPAPPGGGGGATCADGSPMPASGVCVGGTDPQVYCPDGSIRPASGVCPPTAPTSGSCSCKVDYYVCVPGNGETGGGACQSYADGSPMATLATQIVPNGSTMPGYPLGYNDALGGDNTWYRYYSAQDHWCDAGIMRPVSGAPVQSFTENAGMYWPGSVTQICN